jgi:hypothetical protein
MSKQACGRSFLILLSINNLAFAGAIGLPLPTPASFLGIQAARLPKLGLGLASLGRPGYINLGHDQDLKVKTVEGMRQHCHQILDEAYGLGIRYSCHILGPVSLLPCPLSSVLCPLSCYALWPWGTLPLIIRRRGVGAAPLLSILHPALLGCLWVWNPPSAVCNNFFAGYKSYQLLSLGCGVHPLPYAKTSLLGTKVDLLSFIESGCVFSACTTPNHQHPDTSTLHDLTGGQRSSFLAGFKLGVLSKPRQHHV